jgi:hypothetical protein
MVQSSPSSFLSSSSRGWRLHGEAGSVEGVTPSLLTRAMRRRDWQDSRETEHGDWEGSRRVDSLQHDPARQRARVQRADLLGHGACKREPSPTRRLCLVGGFKPDHTRSLL